MWECPPWAACAGDFGWSRAGAAGQVTERSPAEVVGAQSAVCHWVLPWCNSWSLEANFAPICTLKVGGQCKQRLLAVTFDPRDRSSSPPTVWWALQGQYKGFHYLLFQWPFKSAFVCSPRWVNLLLGPSFMVLLSGVKLPSRLRLSFLLRSVRSLCPLLCSSCPDSSCSGGRSIL